MMKSGLPAISVVICTHNPDQARLAVVLNALERQTLPRECWEMLIIDNASTRPLDKFFETMTARLIVEPRVGLAFARQCGITNARADLIVLVDDDNVLEPDFLANARRIAGECEQVGAFGGKIKPIWEHAAILPDWLPEFQGNLALRDFGDEIKVHHPSLPLNYPSHGPVGAGMVVRRSALTSWFDALARHDIVADRSGASLTSGGDNDMVLHILKAGHSVGYYPSLELGHIIPASRLTAKYHAALAYAIMKSWALVLHLHGICPWKPIPPWTAILRKAKALAVMRPWPSTARFIRWKQLCGLIDGQAAIYRRKVG